MSYTELARVVTFRPLSVRLPAPTYDDWRVSPFTASWSDTVDRLVDELRRSRGHPRTRPCWEAMMAEPREIDDYEIRRERDHRWHHDIQRYTTVSRRRDHLYAVWDCARACRVSRWMRPERAARAAADVEANWRTGRGVTGWIYKTAGSHDG